MLGRVLMGGRPVAVLLERDDTPARPVLLGKGTGVVTVRGAATEILLFLWGRGRVAQVELLGDPADIDVALG